MTPAPEEDESELKPVFAWAWTLFEAGAMNERRLTWTKDDPFAIVVNGGDGHFVSIAVPLYTRAKPSSKTVQRAPLYVELTPGEE